MGYLAAIEALISNTSADNEVKGGGDYWYQQTAGTEEDGEWSDDQGAGWIIRNTLLIKINDAVVFDNTEEEVVNFNCEENKWMVIENREAYYKKMLEILIQLGY
jgi:hypothetical protein